MYLFLTVFSPLIRSSVFISENIISDGSALNDTILNVSPSKLLIDKVLSSEPSANKLSSFQAPQIIFLECFPIIGVRLKNNIANFYRFNERMDKENL